MKKSILFIAAGALALSACTSSEVIEEGVQSNAIGFQTVIGKPSRAVTLIKDNLTKFYVYSYYTKSGMTANPVNVFEGQEVYLDTETKAWKYDDTRYWVSGGTYNFYAYSCNSTAITTANGNPAMDLTASDATGRALNINDYVCNKDHQNDLIFASTENVTGKEAAAPEEAPANSKVAFTFKHILTKINAVFTSEFASGYDIVVSNVKLVNVRDKGNYNPKGDPAWEEVKRTKDDSEVLLEVSSDNNVATDDEDETKVKKVTTGDAFVIPFAYTEANVRLEFNIQVKQGNDVFLSRTLKGTWKPNWVPGYSYTYQIKITGTAANLEPIVFETADNMNIDGFTVGTNVPEIEFSAN